MGSNWFWVGGGSSTLRLVRCNNGSLFALPPFLALLAHAFPIGDFGSFFSFVVAVEPVRLTSRALEARSAIKSGFVHLRAFCSQERVLNLFGGRPVVAPCDLDAVPRRDPKIAARKCLAQRAFDSTCDFGRAD